MKFTINKENFVKELGKIQGIGEKRQTMLILSNVLISAEAGKVSLLSTNMEVGMMTNSDADVIEKGKTTTSAKNLYDICKEMPTGLLEIETEENILKIKGGKAEFKIPTLPSGDFPKVPLPSKTPKVNIESSKLKNMMDKVTFCASTDETKYHLNSVFVDNSSNKGWLRMVSTDGHRLGMIDSPICDLETLGIGKGILIPRKGATELRKIIETAENVSIMVESSYMYIFAGNTVLFIKEIDLEYPDYLRVIPGNNDKSFKVKRTDLLSALKRVSIVSTIKSRTCSISLNQGALQLSSRSPDYGEATEEIEVDYSKTPMEIRFNSKYLIDILSATTEDVLSFEMGDPLSPVLIRPNEGSSDSLYVVMPMRL
ncbi:MAG: DNA polymerase III subunit beta [Proteobacteria bacterium]|nr:DNA polymerase III subunit beta [Pseudomonadota bacterium]